jgi:hypothetical protein
VTTPFLTTGFENTKTNEQNLHLLLFAYAQSINKLKKEAAGRVLDYWFAWTGVDFFRKLVYVIEICYKFFFNILDLVLTAVIKAYKSIVVYVINLQVVTSDSEVTYRHNLLKSSMLFLQKLHKVSYFS